MRIVILTEKPSVAKDIARVLGVNKDTRAYIGGFGNDGNEYRITWCLGHLLEIYVEEAEGTWDLEKLPILPRKVVLRPIGEGSFKPVQDTEGGKDEGRTGTVRNIYADRLRVIRDAFTWCDRIIAATDAGREGQGIFQNVYAYLGIKRDVQRLWIQSLTDAAIRDGLDHLLPYNSPEMYNLARAAWQRALSDWLVGVNATRAFTKASAVKDYSGRDKVLSLGRVQTPTLCMICERYEEHINFRSEDYWYLAGTTEKDGQEFRVRGDQWFMRRELADRALDGVIGERRLYVTDVNTERRNELPPLLHDIASLQKIANSRYGMTLEKTVDIVESLYLKHLVTYPRTGSRYLTEDVFKTVPELVKRLLHDKEYGAVARDLLDGGKFSHRSVDNAKVTDHHALIITENRCPPDLTEDEAAVYDLILSRFLEAISPVCVADLTTIRLESAGVQFTVKGRKELSSGWRAVTKGKVMTQTDSVNPDEAEFDTGDLPALAKGDVLPVKSMEIVEDKTKPKPLLTDATLLTQMEKAGRRVDDKQMVSILKDIGIGTPATRHEVLKTLETRGFVTRSKKAIKPTALGLDVWATVKDLEIANVEMTAHWEIRLDRIKNGQEDPSVFEGNIRKYTHRMTRELIDSESVKGLRDKMEREHPMLRCPRCGEPLRLSEKSAWCKACAYTVWRNFRGTMLSDSAMRSLLQNGTAGPVTLTSREGKEYSGMLSLEKDGKITMTFNNKR